GKRYWVRKLIGSTFYYGSAALAVSQVTNRFYVMTQMSSAGPKDIVAIEPVAGTMTVIGTTPTTLNDYHFVKMAIAPNGFSYAIGVHRDTSGAAATCNPLIRFNTCLTAGCATPTITILGYLPATGITYKWNLFNGDIAFDASGNLYFATAGYGKIVGTRMGYTDARLFKINVASIPSVAGAGIIPMSLYADYSTLDSTVINGIALDLAGNMYLSTRVFSGVQGAPSTISIPKLFKSTLPGNAVNMAGFSSPTPNFSIGDLASCNFPNTILPFTQVRLSGKAESGRTDLKWELNNNEDADYFELQRSSDAEDFKTIASIPANYTGYSTAKYSYTDNQVNSSSHAYYRVRAVMKSGIRNYSNVMNILIRDELLLTSSPNPNPFVDHLDCELSLKVKRSIRASIMDQRGSLVMQLHIDCNAGENKITINGLTHLKPGMYILEFRIDEQVVRSKLIKQ
ncbi:MAG TPA: T9SS type A sorting domain-containing protein, partial [Chitinophagaceae bacterium]|nr:T9SS type A sorting domain-containing protein [Chitinophagaceae bacterium]